jgi:hypothetical protein
LDQTLGDGGIEEAPAPVACDLDGGWNAADPMRHLDELRDLSHPRGNRDAFTGKLSRPALTVPPLVAGAESVEHPIR